MTKREKPQAYATVKGGLRVGIAYDMDEEGLIDVRILNGHGYRFPVDDTLSYEDWQEVYAACYEKDRDDKEQDRIAYFINEEY